MTATITLIAYLVVLVPLMLLGFYFARRKMFNPQHKLVMTSVVILNWIFIAIFMSPQYRANVAPNIPADIGQLGNLVPTIHLLTGGIAQLLATYLVLLMWTENTPVERLVPFRTRNIKPFMRTTLALWLTTVLLGVGIYGIWNTGGGDTTPPAATEQAPDPDATEEAPDPDATEESGD